MNKKKIKKSQIYLIGSLLILIGILALSYNYLKKSKEEVFNDMKLLVSQQTEKDNKEVVKAPEVEQIKSTTGDASTSQNKNINYSKYVGILEIPKIRLKRGFYNVDSKYNDINYNVTVIKGSTFPDVARGNLMLIAHSGDAYISYFRYLYKLSIGDYAKVTYKGIVYNYKIVNIYYVDKVGSVSIERNYDVTTLTLITCTNNDDTKQTVYIAELV